MMTRDLDAPLRNLDGTPIVEGGKPAIVDGNPTVEGGKPLLMATVATSALLAQVPGETPTGDDKAARFRLAIRLHAGGAQDIKAEDLALLKKLVGQLYNPLVVGQVFAWCDSDPAPSP